MQPMPGPGNFTLRALTLAAAILSVIISGCRGDVTTPPFGESLSSIQMSALAKETPRSFQQINLVANDAAYAPRRVDASLLNAWGIAFNPNGIVWIAANHAGVSVVYDSAGNAKRSPVTIPTGTSSEGGAPTGLVFNPTGDFAIPPTGEASKFIFASEDGILSAWGSGSSAAVVVDRSSSDAVYKGLALANDGSHNFLYATNFKGGVVEVFDANFHMVSNPGFQDPAIPAGFAPFGIQNIDGNLFVTYAKQKGPDNMDDQSGPGNGYIDVYGADGKLLRRFASTGMLNSPWGVAQVPDGGFRGLKDAILVGNFGDGRINIFDEHGKFEGQLSDSANNPITITGLWALAFAPSGQSFQKQGRKADQPLFFTAGPNDENDGIFGYLNIRRTVDERGDGNGDGHGNGSGDGHSNADDHGHGQGHGDNHGHDDGHGGGHGHGHRG
jgi:uncharacterized protein (TIGR03118 family)